ncbi:hypothetical protein HYW74_05105 [Candidatus Pacearchaeota archaeon]|nr:hypothetical protein [Candidatus Pacearchaeota archaeon]
MESYRTFNTNYIDQGVFYSPEGEGGASYKETLPREKPVHWARESANWLEKAKNPLNHLRSQLVGQCPRVFTKKPEEPGVSR